MLLVASGLAFACSASDGDDIASPSAAGEVPDGAPQESKTPCSSGAECPSGICNVKRGECEAPTCTDAVKSGDETDLDCGGSCAPCDVGKACGVGADCTTGACNDVGAGRRCQPPSPTDGVENGAETDVDCGGAGNPPCADGKKCKEWSDCASDYCAANVCAAPKSNDGAQNGDETDVDCGGKGAPPCNDGLKCLVDGDCKSDVCEGAAGALTCQVPSPTDKKKNGHETDVDCGGDGAPKCATGKSCLVGADCASLGCNYALKCAAGRSCTRRYGGDTCGLGGAGGVGAEQWEDCCATAVVTPTSGPTSGVPIKLGKYQVTAGRMRAFLTDVNYDVRAFVKQARLAGKIPVIPGNAQNRILLEADWDMFLPTSFAGNTNAGEIADCAQGDTTTATGTDCKAGTLQAGIYTSVRNHLGGFIFKGNNQTSTGCYVGSPGTHAFRFPDNAQDGPKPQLDQDGYDTKSMQCIDYLVAQAFCIWDGGRLELLEEWQAAWGPGALPYSAQTTRTPVAPGTDTYWGCRFPWATDANQDDCGAPWNAATQTIEYADYQYSYEWPKLDDDLGDFIVFISAPGRTRGRGPAGHADVIGNNYELTSDVGYHADVHTATHSWSGNGSWEVHAYNKSGVGTTNLLNKYGKLGLRCAYP